VTKNHFVRTLELGVNCFAEENRPTCHCTMYFINVYKGKERCTLTGRVLRAKLLKKMPGGGRDVMGFSAQNYSF